MNKFLQLIAEEKDGFSFGESWRYNEDSLCALLPILRESKLNRSYLLLSEAEKVEIKDTGQINKVEIKNNESKPLYVRIGEIIAGKTQERATIRSYVIMPGESVSMEVKCVHASKGIQTGEVMTSKGFVTPDLEVNFCSANFKMRNVEQRDVWKSVNDTASYMSASSNSLNSNRSSDGFSTGQNFNFTDDLTSNIENFSKVIDGILKKVPYFDDQVGIVMMDLKGVSGVECFDLKDSWKLLRDTIIKKDGEQISKQDKDSPFEYKKHKVVKSAKSLLLSNFEEKVLFKSKDYILIGMKFDSYVGELTTLKGVPIHFMLTRTIK